MKIALIGLDGSGKSANINLMKSDPEYKGFEFLWVRWQPSITVMLYKIRHRNDTVGARNNSESGKKKQKTLEGNYQRKKGIKKILFGMGITRKLWFFYAIGDYKRQFHNKTQQLIANGSNIIFDRWIMITESTEGSLVKSYSVFLLSMRLSPEAIDLKVSS